MNWTAANRVKDGAIETSRLGSYVHYMAIDDVCKGDLELCGGNVQAFQKVSRVAVASGIDVSRELKPMQFAFTRCCRTIVIFPCKLGVLHIITGKRNHGADNHWHSTDLLGHLVRGVGQDHSPASPAVPRTAEVFQTATYRRRGTTHNLYQCIREVVG